MGKGKMVALRVSEVEKKQLEKDAKEERRSVSSLLLWCWEQWKKGKKGKLRREDG